MEEVTKPETSIERGDMPASEQEEKRGYAEAARGATPRPPADPLLAEVYERGRRRFNNQRSRKPERSSGEDRGLREAARSVVEKASRGGYGEAGMDCPYIALMDNHLR